MRRTTRLRISNNGTSHITEFWAAVAQCVGRYQPHAAGCFQSRFRRVNRASRSYVHSYRRDLLDRGHGTWPLCCERAYRENGNNRNSDAED